MTSPPAGPSVAQAYELAIAHHRAGRFREAELLYRQILASAPNHADSLHMLGVMALQAGQHSDALKLISRALELQPSNWEFQSNLGLVHRAMGQSEKELDCYRRALTLQPSAPGAHYNVGFALAERKEFGAAIAEYRHALSLWPDFPEALNNLGEALRETGQLKEAIAVGRRAVEVRPNWPQALNNLALSLRENDELDEAIATYQRALSLTPDYAECLSGFGHALHISGRLDEAIAVLRRACSLKPEWLPARWNLAHALLVKDHALEGWLAYEARRGLQKGFPSYDKNAEWTGGELSGRRLLVYAEQGFGDAIQMARYLSLLAQRGAIVTLECQAELAQLMRGVVGVSEIIPRGKDVVRRFDLHVPMMSLPLRFGTTTATIPASVPYIHADQKKADDWRQRLLDHSGWLKVGIVWAGSSEHKGDRRRSIPLQDFSALANIEQVDFYSLQKGRGAKQAKSPPPGLALIDLTEHLHDWSDTAAMIANLDLVISVDTAVAHLAGAMGKTAMVLLPFIPDWRWLMHRGDSPWYPTLRLFRQPKAGDWQTPVGQVANALRELVK